MKVTGGGNLRTMAPAASTVIDGTNQVYVETALGRFEVQEASDGSLHVTFRGAGQVCVLPCGSNTVVLSSK